MLDRHSHRATEFVNITRRYNDHCGQFILEWDMEKNKDIWNIGYLEQGHLDKGKGQEYLETIAMS